MGEGIWGAVRLGFYAMGRWEGITAISTAAAAVFTAVMAFLTRKAIKDGQGQREDTNSHFEVTRAQDKRHHEDSFRPLLLLAQTDVTDIYSRGGTVKALLIDSYKGVVVIKCLIRNIGMGPALNVRLHFRSDGRAGFGPTRELLPIAAGGEYGDSEERLEVLVFYHDNFNRTDQANADKGLWTLVLEYEDIFGNPFHTLHCKDPSQPWARAGRGAAPVV